MINVCVRGVGEGGWVYCWRQGVAMSLVSSSHKMVLLYLFFIDFRLEFLFQLAFPFELI